jgi:hypothetical protein
MLPGEAVRGGGAGAGSNWGRAAAPQNGAVLGWLKLTRPLARFASGMACRTVRPRCRDTAFGRGSLLLKPFNSVILNHGV